MYVQFKNTCICEFLLNYNSLRVCLTFQNKSIIFEPSVEHEINGAENDIGSNSFVVYFMLSNCRLQLSVLERNAVVSASDQILRRKSEINVTEKRLEIDDYGFWINGRNRKRGLDSGIVSIQNGRIGGQTIARTEPIND